MTTILIADDHEVVRSGLRMILEAQPGWQVIAEAGDGKEAIAKAVESRPDVIILDYSLPLVNGIEATRQIRLRSPNAEILIFTMHESDMVVRDILRAGARGYLLKSDAQRFLIAAVESVAAHQPFFTSTISETLLKTFLADVRHSESVLTPRERSVVRLIAEGHTNKQIASLLGIRVKTVETHRARIMHKLNLSSTAALVRYAIRNRIAEP